jgi:hypothetical protein
MSASELAAAATRGAEDGIVTDSERPQIRGVMPPCNLLALLALAVPSLAAQGKAPHPVSPRRPALKRAIAVGETVRDSLTRHDPLLPADSTYAQQWRLVATRAGETVTIDLVADTFDVYLLLLGPGLEREQPQDDDSGGRCNARLTVRLPQAGDYYVVVTSSDRFRTGAFELSVTAGAKPPSLVPCNR